MPEIKKVCVIGSGVMGSGIAAQIANSKTQVLLLDIANEKSDDASCIARQAVSLLATQKPAPLSHPSLTNYIEVGNLRDDLEKIQQCDLIIEVIVEKLEIKHALYDSLLPYLKQTAIIASNTSTLPLKQLKQNLSKSVQDRFVITHFFNPPRYMELLELISDKDMPSLTDFLTIKLGKTIVKCNDTPGFIANRIGCFLLELVTRTAIINKLNPVKIDQIFHKLLGFPSTGIFGLYDLIGHDVMALISDSLCNALAKDDRYQQLSTASSALKMMQDKNYLGRKSGSGFYKLRKQGNLRIKEILDLETMEYTEIQEINIPASITELLNNNDEYAIFFRDILKTFFNYTISLMPSISNNPYDIDKAMRLGYSLKYGPIELITFMPDGFIDLPKSLTNYKAPIPQYELTKTIISNNSAKLIQHKQQHIFVINIKMNTLNQQVFELLIDSVKRSEDAGKNLYIYPAQSANFSAGADIKLFYNNITKRNWKAIEELITLGQQTMLTLKHSETNIISCAYGLALGGGCELLLHSDLVIAHQNLNAGLVELGVGLIPGWGGVKEMFLLGGQNPDLLIQNLSNILMQNKTSSGDYFAMYYKENCQINMNKEFILDQALNTNVKKQAKITNTKIPQIDLSQVINTSTFDELQIDVLEFFQKIIDLKEVDELTLLALEKEKFLELSASPLCLKRLALFK
ncbi:MAG: 3-hydroxyacyl-CoA dehydrogenase/enoyl-CoA hydratase family protein [Rickettsiaceae bacterium]|nr:3-hydroxyacyl-CoA dehydrogenase/enoyl-CoA hydratase family protein [Rickettsiaceae bacterium]MDP5020981.1 3-hydroxyacyl-CoA dehydrogenase/enoyl-CoA hydratase family protein [Rickettsiaceae bacterium]MDP5082650.1 3-hydroxyacyl-CoA dehydrogenase/enoyl-CoA hydratase family protein [Rickettsiaceae bacterium]